MSGFYTVAYAVGFRPWERAGREAAEQFGELLDREAMERPTPPWPRPLHRKAGSRS
jgi:hypothetical protein